MEIFNLLQKVLNYHMHKMTYTLPGQLEREIQVICFKRRKGTMLKCSHGNGPFVYEFYIICKEKEGLERWLHG